MSLHVADAFDSLAVKNNLLWCFMTGQIRWFMERWRRQNIPEQGVVPISESTNQATAPSCFANSLKLDRKTFRPLRLTETSSFPTCFSVLHLTLGHTLAQGRGSVQAHLLISDRKVAGISAIFRVGALNAQRVNAGSFSSRSYTGNRGSVQADLLTSESVL